MSRVAWIHDTVRSARTVQMTLQPLRLNLAGHTGASLSARLDLPNGWRFPAVI
jgi:hypothetical protein